MKATSHHIESLDVFRGLTIASMILVNNPGDWSSVYPQLMHAAWNGCTFADLVFPCFIFIVGVAATFAFSRRRDAGHETRAIAARIGRRALTLIALGLVLNLFGPPTASGAVRFPGVLQRIGLVYLAASLIVLHTNVTGRLVAAALLLIGHTIVLLYVPFGSHHAGLIEASANLPGWLDHLLFGRHAMTPTFDPEGLLGTIPATATALLGSVAGRWLRATPNSASRLAALAAGGCALLAIAYATSWILPLNKTLWTAPYALLTAGVAAIVLAVCYLVIDVAGIRLPTRPFVWLGVNPLAIYFLSEIAGHLELRAIHIAGEATTPQSWIFWSVFFPMLDERLSLDAISLLIGLLTVLIWIGVAGVLYRRGIRIVV